MKLGVLTASASNKAGGMFGVMIGQSKALNAIFKTKIHIFGLEDELSHRDQAGWGALPVTTCKVQGPGMFGYSPNLVPILGEAKLDLLHVHGLWMYTSIASTRWARGEQKPYLITIHGMLDQWAIHNSRTKKLIAGWLYENTHLRNAACLQAGTMAEVRSIRAYGLRNPICLIPHGIEIPGNTTFKEGEGGRTRELLFLGRIHPKKGLVNLLHAWYALQQDGNARIREWVLTIAGWDQGGHEDELKALSNQLGIQESVRFVGPQFGADKKSTYSGAQAFILPSFSEGLPLAVLEAWSYNLPVLITPECNIPEGFDAAAAIQIGTESNKIVTGISQLITMTDRERQSMGARGKQLVDKKFSWNKIARELHSVYQWMLGLGEKPDCVLTT